MRACPRRCSKDNGVFVDLVGVSQNWCRNTEDWISAVGRSASAWAGGEAIQLLVSMMAMEGQVHYLMQELACAGILVIHWFNLECCEMMPLAESYTEMRMRVEGGVTKQPNC
jgi:hypothetical protein